MLIVDCISMHATHYYAWWKDKKRKKKTLERKRAKQDRCAECVRASSLFSFLCLLSNDITQLRTHHQNGNNHLHSIELRLDPDLARRWSFLPVESNDIMRKHRVLSPDLETSLWTFHISKTKNTSEITLFFWLRRLILLVFSLILTRRHIFLWSRSRPMQRENAAWGTTTDRCQIDAWVNIEGHRSEWEENKRPTSTTALVASLWSNICSGTLFGRRDENLSLGNSFVLDEDVDSIRLSVFVWSRREHGHRDEWKKQIVNGGSA